MVVEGRKTHSGYFPSQAQGVGELAGRFQAGRLCDWTAGKRGGGERP
jgi:hypothetical protein